MKNTKQQTAVEWQFNELQRAEKYYKNEAIDGLEYTKIIYKILEKAKEMEKQQIVDAYNQDNSILYQGIESGEQYYNKTFNK